MKRCPKCFESETQEDWVFCPRCGAELEEIVAGVRVITSNAVQPGAIVALDPNAAAELCDTLQEILERADYIDGTCQPNKRVCAALPPNLIRRARAAVMRALRI